MAQAATVLLSCSVLVLRSMYSRMNLRHGATQGHGQDAGHMRQVRTHSPLPMPGGATPSALRPPPFPPSPPSPPQTGVSRTAALHTARSVLGRSRAPFRAVCARASAEPHLMSCTMAITKPPNATEPMW